MASASKQERLTTTDLDRALEPAQERDRFSVFERYSKQKPSVDAVPVLIRALNDDYHAVVKCAADSLRKLGPQAIDAVEDLFTAACKIDPTTRMPQAYCECLGALVAIDRNNEELITLIKGCVGLDNWHPFKNSMQALIDINTDESIQLLKRMYVFWEPELNKQQKKNALKIIGGYINDL